VVLDHRAEVGTLGDPVDGLADHHVEAAVRPRRFGEEVGDAAVRGNRDRELFTRLAPAALGKVRPTNSTS
jgi:hypothetical protein